MAALIYVARIRRLVCAAAHEDLKLRSPALRGFAHLANICQRVVERGESRVERAAEIFEHIRIGSQLHVGRLRHEEAGEQIRGQHAAIVGEGACVEAGHVHLGAVYALHILRRNAEHGLQIILIIGQRAVLYQRRELLQAAVAVGEIYRGVALHGRVGEVRRQLVALHEAVVEGEVAPGLLAEHAVPLCICKSLGGHSAHVFVLRGCVAPYHGVQAHGRAILKAQSTALGRGLVVGYGA